MAAVVVLVLVVVVVIGGVVVVAIASVFAVFVYSGVALMFIAVSFDVAAAVVGFVAAADANCCYFYCCLCYCCYCFCCSYCYWCCCCCCCCFCSLEILPLFLPMCLLLLVI